MKISITIIFRTFWVADACISHDKSWPSVRMKHLNFSDNYCFGCDSLQIGVPFHDTHNQCQMHLLWWRVPCYPIFTFFVQTDLKLKRYILSLFQDMSNVIVICSNDIIYSYLVSSNIASEFKFENRICIPIQIDKPYLYPSKVKWIARSFS